MDYRGYENKFNEIKKSITDFIVSKNEKVDGYALDTVKSYLDLLNKNDISVKSFKLKIVHNGQTCKKNLLEMEELFPNTLNSVKEFMDVFFQEYEKNLPNYKFYQNRKTDLLLMNSHLKRKRQDALVRINNYEKDLVNKEKEISFLISEKTKNHNQFVIETNRRLSIDLQRNSDNSMKEYLTLENELLDVDEKTKILEIKDKIKSIRSKSLNKETELKLKSFNNLKDEEIKYFNEINDIELEYENFKKEYQCKILESKKSIQLYQLEEIRNSFEFDYEKDIEAIEKYKKYVNEYLNIIKNTNEGIINNSYLETTDFNIEMKILKTTLVFYSYGFFNPVIRVMDGIKKIYDEINNYYDKMLLNNKKNKDDKYLLIFEKLERFDEKVFKNKKTNFEEFLVSIDTGLNNLYSNEYIDKQRKLLINFIDNVLDIVINLSNKFISKIDEKTIDFDNILIDKYEMENDIDSYDEKLCYINEKIRLIENITEDYCKSFIQKRDKEKTEFYLEDKNKLVSIESHYSINLNQFEKETKKVIDAKNLVFQKKIKDLNNEFNKNCLGVNNTLKYYKKIL